MSTPYRSGARAFRDRAAVTTNFRLISTTNIPPLDADLKRGQCALWFDSTAGAPKINFKAKDAAGTVTTGQLKGSGGGGAAIGYSLSGPASGNNHVASSPFTVALEPPGGTVGAPVVITPSDQVAGGTFTPATVSLSTASPSATFTYTPSITGTRAVSCTNNGGLANPANATYVVS